ncbi:hypothetical protein Bca101_001024 [Brassica carinata]
MPRTVRGDGQSFEIDEFVIFVGKVERRDGISLSYHLCRAFSARLLRYNRLTLISPRREISEASPRNETQSSRSPSPLRAISVSRRTRRGAESLGLVGGYIESKAFIFVEERFELSPVLVNISSSVEPISMSLGLDVDEFVTHGDEMPRWDHNDKFSA